MSLSEWEVNDGTADDWYFLGLNPHTNEPDPDMWTRQPEGAAMPDTTTESPIDAADRLAPAPATRDDATSHAWVRYYAAQALACYATLRTETRNLPRNPAPGSRPDIGYLSIAAQASVAAAAAFLGSLDAPSRVWDLTPELGSLNGEYEEWLADVLVRFGINPGLIDPHLDPADFADTVAAHQ